MVYEDPAWIDLNFIEMLDRGIMPPPPQWDVDQLNFVEFNKLFEEEGFRGEQSIGKMTPQGRVLKQSQRRVLFVNDCKRILMKLKDPEFWNEWIWMNSKNQLLSFIEVVKEKGPIAGYLLLLHAAMADPHFKGRRRDFHSLPSWAKNNLWTKSEWEAAIRN